jgi:hypothetical protein
MHQHPGNGVPPDPGVAARSGADQSRTPSSLGGGVL